MYTCNRRSFYTLARLIGYFGIRETVYNVGGISRIFILIFTIFDPSSAFKKTSNKFSLSNEQKKYKS